MTDTMPPTEAGSANETFIPIQYVQRTDVGRVRSENQDFAITTSPDESLRYGYLLVVADGMGGHRGGATASRMAGNIVREEFIAASKAPPTESLHLALTRANERIHNESLTNADLRGMGTTCSVLLVRGNTGWIAHVGDSRVYRVRNDQIELMTQDHSLVATMVREGLITEEEAEVHPRRNVLQRSMGVVEEIEVDVYDPFEILPGDSFILCSDGLHGLVKSGEIRQVVTDLDPEKAVDRFIELALERGAHDNVTVIVARAGEPTEKPDVPPAPVEDDVVPTLERPVPQEPMEIHSAPTLEIDPSVYRQAEPGGAPSALKWIVIALLTVAAIGAVVLIVGESAILGYLQKQLGGR